MSDRIAIEEWWGPAKSMEEAAEIKADLIHIKTEWDCVLALIELFKAGDFSTKNLLIDLMNTTKDEGTLNTCVSLFMQIATHKDIRDIRNFDFLSDISQDGIRYFCLSAVDTLSYEIVPYLLALLDEWEGTDVENDIRYSLQEIISYEKMLDEHAPTEDIGQYWINEVKFEAGLYYYDQKPAFPGELTKELGMMAAIAANAGSQLNTYRPTTLLSIWSGIRCPVEYATVMDDTGFQDVRAYVDKIRALEWERGHKYFYHHEIQ